MISAEASAEPGQWRTDRAPYLREIMDTVSNPSVRDVCVMSAAQIGKTEILLNVIGFYIHFDPSPILLLEPTIDLAATVSKTRVAPMVRDTKVITDKVAPPKSRDSSNTVLEKMFTGGSLTLAGANSPNSLASRPIKVLLLDEVDRMPRDVKNEGDAIELAKQRTSNFYSRKIVSVSTPTVKGVSRVEHMFQEGSQGHYHACCVDCGSLFEPKWKDVRWDRDDKGEHDPETATLVCPHCEHKHTDAERYRAVTNGTWIHKFPDRKKKSFHLTALISPWVRLHELVERWLSAKKSVDLLKTFINTVLGETFEESSEGVDNLDFISRREDYERNSLPINVELLTAGIDTQDDRLEYSIVGWGEFDESWVIKHGVIHGDPSAASTWASLKAELIKQYTREDGTPLKILASCIDSGGSHTESVYRFTKENRQRRFWAIKGRSNFQGHLPIFPKRASKSSKYNAQLYTIGVDTAKTLVYSWLRNESPGPGYVHFNMSCDEDYFEQLTAERTKTKYRNGYPYIVWFKQANKRNEALDCYVYATAAKHGLNTSIERIRKLNDKALKRTEVVEEVTTEKVEEKQVINNHKKRITRPRKAGVYVSGMLKI